MAKALDVRSLAESLRDFAAKRDWEQFHTPKNLAMALGSEAGELLEHFQWLTPAESQSLAGTDLDALAEEIADIVIYTVRLADLIGVDVAEAVLQKLAANEVRYPVERYRGTAEKAPHL